MPSRDELIARNNVRFQGEGARVLLLAHGFGCDQEMWRFVIPKLERDYRIVSFDYVGWGGSRMDAYDRERYAHIDGYARDIVDILEGLDLSDVSLVGHSVSAMSGLLASLECPQRIACHVMICPSPCFFNDPPDYHGGFECADLQELLDLMDKNLIGWANHLAPLVLGQNADSELLSELADSFCSTDPVIAKEFAHVSFFSDLRDRLPLAKHPSVLVQSRHDALAGVEIGEYMSRHMPQSELRILGTHGHYLPMTHSDLVAAEIYRFVGTEGAP